MVERLITFLYAPAARTGAAIATPATPPVPVIFFSGEWGWRPLLQDTASFLVSEGRCVLGIDSTDYFKRMLDGPAWASDLETLRGFINEKAGRPKDAPVILAGHSYGAEMVPYILNRAGTRGVLGALLVAPGPRGAATYRVSIQLKLPPPEDEAFDVGYEMHRLPPIPVVAIQGTVDEEGASKDLVEMLRGPRLFVPIVGGDRQFRGSKDLFFPQVTQALRWIEEEAGAPAGAAAGSGPPPPAPAPGPGPTAPPPGR